MVDEITLNKIKGLNSEVLIQSFKSWVFPDRSATPLDLLGTIYITFSIGSIHRIHRISIAKSMTGDSSV